MRLFLTIVLVALLGVATLALDPPLNVDQYMTAAGPRLYFRFATPYFWPMTGFESWQITISTERLGNHPPYVGATSLLSNQNYTDPEMQLLAELPPGEYHCIAELIVTGSYVMDKTSEFLFEIPLPEADPTPYTACLNYVVRDEWGWQSSIVITNPGDQPVDGHLILYRQDGSLAKTWYYKLLGHQIQPFFVNDIVYAGDFSIGSIILKSTVPVGYHLMTIHTSGITLSESGQTTP